MIKHCDKYKEDKVYLDSQVRVTGRCDEAAVMRLLRWKGLGGASHTAACGTEAETGRQMGTGPQPALSI